MIQKLFHSGASLRRSLLLLILSASLFTACHTVKVSRIEAVNIHLDSTLAVAPDPLIESIIRPYRDQLMKDMNEVLCQSKSALMGGRPESPLTNFCADLLKTESDSICLKKYPAIHIDLSLVNRGGLRVPIPKGEVKVQDMFELMPFENEVVFLRLHGSELRALVDHLASRGGEGVSGIRFGIKQNLGVTPELNGVPLNEQRDYWLTTSDYLANGGDGSGILKNSVERINTGVKFRDLFINHLRKLGKQGKAIDIKQDGRVYYAK